MKIKLVDGDWQVLPDGSPDGIYINSALKSHLDNIKDIINKGWDAMFLIDGPERSGKSTLGILCGWYLTKGQLTINNFAKGLDDAKEKIKILPDRSLLIVDEGSLVFSSLDSTTRENKELQKILDVVGQKNMTFIVILPSFFDLSKPIATRRSLFLLHVFVDKDWNRGRFAYFGRDKKPKLYELGKKNFNKYLVKSDFAGKFEDFETPFHKEYLKLKKDTLMQQLEAPKSKKEIILEDKVTKARAGVVKLIDYFKLPIAESAKVLGIHDGEISVWRRNNSFSEKIKVSAAPVSIVNIIPDQEKDLVGPIVRRREIND